MNTEMYNNPITQRNLEGLRSLATILWNLLKDGLLVGYRYRAFTRA